MSQDLLNAILRKDYGAAKTEFDSAMRDRLSTVMSREFKEVASEFLAPRRTEVAPTPDAK